jgi:transposase
MQESNPTGRRYDREFKENAVALVSAGRTISSVARDLGVTTCSLGRWVQNAKTGSPQRENATLSTETPEARELRRLKQENDYLRQQRDILKKRWASYQRTCPHTPRADREHEKRTFHPCFGRGPGSVRKRLLRSPSQSGW